MQSANTHTEYKSRTPSNRAWCCVGWRRIVQSVLVYKEGVQGAVSASGWIRCANQNLGATLEIPAPVCRPPNGTRRLHGSGDANKPDSIMLYRTLCISVPVHRVTNIPSISQASGRSNKEMTRLNCRDTIRHFTKSVFFDFSIAHGYMFLLFSKSRLARGSQVLPAPAANTAWKSTGTKVYPLHH